MPKIVDAAEQRQAIRSAARRVFARRGVNGTGLGHVAEAAGMGRTSLYHYYPDKVALLRDLAAHVLEEEEALFAAVLDAGGRPRERLERLAGALVDTFDEWSAAGRMLFDLRLGELGRFRPFFRRVRRRVADVIAEGQRRGEIDRALAPELAASTLIGAVDGLLLQHFADSRAFPDRAALREALVGAVRKVLLP